MSREIGRLDQFDVKYACAHGDLEEEVYMEIGLGQLVEGMGTKVEEGTILVVTVLLC
jgi:hypothetical protein